MRGLSLSYVSVIITTAVGLWLTPFLLSKLGAQDYGLWLVVGTLLTYLGLLDLGVVALLPRETAYATGRGENAATEIQLVIGRTFRLVMWQLPIVAAVSLGVWLLLPEPWLELQNALGWILLVFVLGFPLRMANAILIGLQDLTFVGIAQIVVWALSTLATIVCVMLDLGLNSLVLGWVITQLGASVCSLARLRSRFPDAIPTIVPAMTWTVARKQLADGLWVSVGQIATVMIRGTELIIIARVIGPEAVVLYSCTDKLGSVLANQPLAILQNALPALSQMKIAESKDRLLQVCTALTQAMLVASGAIACCVMAINQSFVVKWVGPAHFGGNALLACLLASMMLRHWNASAVYSIFCFGYQKHISVTMLVDGVVTVGSGILLVREIGPVGAPLGSILGVLIVGLPSNLGALARESGVTRWVLVRSLLPWFWRFGVIAAPVWYFTTVGWTMPIAGMLLVGAGVGFAYVALMVPVVLRPPLGPYVRTRVHSLPRWLRSLIVGPQP